MIAMIAGSGFFLSLSLFLFVIGTEALFPKGVRILLALSPRGMGRENGESIEEKSKWGQEPGCGQRSG